MTNRERAMNILHYKDIDRLPAVHFGYWPELIKEWEDDYLLKDREAFESLYKPKMLYSPERVDLEFFKNFNETRQKDVPVGLSLGSVLGRIRDMTSVMGMSYLMYDEDEELFADIIDTYAQMQYECAKAVLETGAKFELVQYYIEEIKKIKF